MTINRRITELHNLIKRNRRLIQSTPISWKRTMYLDAVSHYLAEEQDLFDLLAEKMVNNKQFRKDMGI